MLDKKNLRSIKKGLHQYALIRRDIIKLSGDALHHSKRAIFAIHRGNLKEAELKIKEALGIFKALHKKYQKNPEITQEGAYKAGVEEYVEAVLMMQFVKTGKIGTIKDFEIVPELYLAGLCDVPGELQRYAVRAATVKDHQTVQKCAEMAEKIIGELIEFDLTRYLRTKFDQAKQASRKIEGIVYDLSLRSDK